MKLEIGKKYRFTLVSGRVVEVIVYGTSGKGIDVSVDGNRDTYIDLDAALGEPFTQVNPGLTFHRPMGSEPMN